MELNLDKIEFDSIEKRIFSTNISTKELLESDAKLLCVSAYACCGRSEMLNNEVVIEGIVKFCAVIKHQDSIKKIEKTERFNINENLSGIQPNSKMLSTASAQKVKCYVEAGNLMFSCSVNVNAIIITPKECTYIGNLEGDEYRKKENVISVFKSNLIKNLRFNFSDNTELSPRLPEINNILDVNAYVNVKETHVSAGQLIIGGEIFLQTLYNSSDEYEPIIQISDKFDFSHLIDINELDTGKPTVILNVEDINTNVALNEQGEMRIINYNISLIGFAYSGENVEYNLITDVYSIKNKIECEKVPISFSSVKEEIRSLINKNINIPVPQSNNPISRINSVNFTPEIISCEIIDSKAYIKCSSEVSVIYIASGTSATEGFNTNVNFEFVVENDLLDEISDSLAFLKMQDMQAVLVSGKEIELRCGMNLCFIPEKKFNSEVVNNIKSSDSDEFPEFGIIVYNVQKKDTLWDICKKYGVDNNELIKLNKDLSDPLEVGKKIYIFRRISV